MKEAIKIYLSIIKGIQLIVFFLFFWEYYGLNSYLLDHSLPLSQAPISGLSS
jgi:hypothetical protein